MTHPAPSAPDGSGTTLAPEVSETTFTFSDIYRAGVLAIPEALTWLEQQPRSSHPADRNARTIQNVQMARALTSEFHLLYPQHSVHVGPIWFELRTPEQPSGKETFRACVLKLRVKNGQLRAHAVMQNPGLFGSVYTKTHRLRYELRDEEPTLRFKAGSTQIDQLTAQNMRRVRIGAQRHSVPNRPNVTFDLSDAPMYLNTQHTRYGSVHQLMFTPVGLLNLTFHSRFGHTELELNPYLMRVPRNPLEQFSALPTWLTHPAEALIETTPLNEQLRGAWALLEMGHARPKFKSKVQFDRAAQHLRTLETLLRHFGNVNMNGFELRLNDRHATICACLKPDGTFGPSSHTDRSYQFIAISAVYQPERPQVAEVRLYSNIPRLPDTLPDAFRHIWPSGLGNPLPDAPFRWRHWATRSRFHLAEL